MCGLVAAVAHAGSTKQKALRVVADCQTPTDCPPRNGTAVALAKRACNGDEVSGKLNIKLEPNSLTKGVASLNLDSNYQGKVGMAINSTEVKSLVAEWYFFSVQRDQTTCLPAKVNNNKIIHLLCTLGSCMQKAPTKE